jgi:hypothetical protein
MQQQPMNNTNISDKIQRHVNHYKQIRLAKETKLKQLQNDFQTYRHPYHLYYEDEAEMVEYRYLEKKIRVLQEDIQYLDEEYHAYMIRNKIYC